MRRNEYFEGLKQALDFMSKEARAEVLADINEYFDFHLAEGMSEEDISIRLGEPETVAMEYRAQEDVNGAMKEITISKSARAVRSSVKAGLVKATVLPFLYIGYFTIIFMLVSFSILMFISLLFSLSCILKWEPIVTTMATPGIPAMSAAFMGMACLVVCFLGIMLMIWCKRRLLISVTKFLGTKLTDIKGDALKNVDFTEVKETEKGKKPQGFYRRIVYRLGILFAVLLLASGTIYVFVPAQDYSFNYQKEITIPVAGTNKLQITSGKIPISLIYGGNEIKFELKGKLKKTFAQQISLENQLISTKMVLLAKYTQGLDWGINKAPILYVTLPESFYKAGNQIKIETSEGKIDIMLPSKSVPFIKFNSKFGELTSEVPTEGNGIEMDITTISADVSITK